MHVDDNQLQRKLDHFHKYKLNMIENYDQQSELLHDQKIVIYQNRYVHFEDESNQSKKNNYQTIFNSCFNLPYVLSKRYHSQRSQVFAERIYQCHCSMIRLIDHHLLTD